MFLVLRNMDDDDLSVSGKHGGDHDALACLSPYLHHLREGSERKKGRILRKERNQV